jgi:UDP-sulfoquinovose synthase
VLGGDGFCGWPTSLHLSRIGCDVTIVDNLSRRHIDQRYSTASLTPIREPEERISAWEELTGRRIGFVNLSTSANPTTNWSNSLQRPSPTRSSISRSSVRHRSR